MTDTPAAETSAPAVPVAQAPAAPADAPRRMALQARVGLVGLVLVALFALFWPRGDGSFAAPGGFLTDAMGQPQTLGPRMAPVTLVHFWATWCPPCLTEVPALDRLMDDFAAERDFDVLMVAVQDDVEKVETFLGSDAAQVLYDHEWDVAHRYGTRKLPETYLVVGGQVVKRWEGAQDWDDAELRRRIRQALAGASDPESQGEDAQRGQGTQRGQDTQRDHGGEPGPEAGPSGGSDPAAGA